MSTRQASDFERGLLVGSMIASMMPNTLMLFLFLMVICYDLGRPRIIEVVQKMLGRMTGIDFESDQIQQLSQTIQTMQNNQPQNNQPIINTQNATQFTSLPNQSTVTPQPFNSNMKTSPSQPTLYQQSMVPGALGFGLNLLNQQLSSSTQPS